MKLIFPRNYAFKILMIVCNCQKMANDSSLSYSTFLRWNFILYKIRNAYLPIRYYGESLPFGSESFSSDGLRYLSSTQATADFAEVINHYKKSKNITQVWWESYLHSQLEFHFPTYIGLKLYARFVNVMMITWTKNNNEILLPVLYFLNVQPK